MNKEEIENFIEEMTKVRPEMLNKQALELFNTIMEILDHVEELEADNYEQNNIINSYIEERRTVIEELEKLANNLEKDGFVGYADNIRDILEMLGEKK